MNKPVKKGKAPISEKYADRDMLDGVNNPLRLDPELEKELIGKGLAWRFISAKKYLADSGFHRNGYVPYKREIQKVESRGSLDFSRGADPEGYVRYKDLVLAVKPEEQKQRHIAHLRKLNENSQGASKRGAAQIRESAREAGISVRVEEGYGEGEE